MKKIAPYGLILICFFLIGLAYHIFSIFHQHQQFEEAVLAGGEWFLNNQNDNFIYYEYFPGTDTHPDTNHALREMGALWSISQLSEFTGDPRYQQLTNRGLNYFLQFYTEDTKNDFAYINITPDKIKLGYNAFIILSLLRSDYPDREKILSSLAQGIIRQQQPDGSLKTFFFSDQTGGTDYYPGEALLALMELYQKTGQEEYRKTVTNALAYYTHYFQTNPNTAFTPWQSRAYAILYQTNPNENIAQFIFDMNDYMLDQYQPAGSCQNFFFDQGIVTAVHAEGVVQAYDIAQLTNDQNRQNCYQNFIREAAEYILTMQIKPSEETPQSAWGGFWDGPGHNGLRVDRNQHAVTFLIDALRRKII